MSGWTSASMRGESLFKFPKNLILLAGMEQVWANHGYIAIRFDADGIDGERYAYPYGRVVGSSVEQTKILVETISTRNNQIDDYSHDYK